MHELTREFCPRCSNPVQDDADSCPTCSNARSRAGWPTDPLIGNVVGEKYRILRRLGAGGFGIVYLSEHVEFGAQRALKVLHDHLAYDSKTVERFRREARAIYRLSAATIVRLEEYGEVRAGVPFMAMEYAEGEPLSDLIVQGGRLPIKKTLTIARHIAMAIADASNQGIVHRDLKPENIRVHSHPRRGEETKVLDFGIARILDERSTTLTGSGILGTPEYMAPELWAPTNPVDTRADLFSLGVILFEMLTGRVPWERRQGEPVTIFAQMRSGPAPKLGALLTDVRLPDGLEALVSDLLALDVDKRPRDAAEVIARIDALNVLTTGALRPGRLSRPMTSPNFSPPQPLFDAPTPTPTPTTTSTPPTTRDSTPLEIGTLPTLDEARRKAAPTRPVLLVAALVLGVAGLYALLRALDDDDVVGPAGEDASVGPIVDPDAPDGGASDEEGLAAADTGPTAEPDAPAATQGALVERTDAADAHPSGTVGLITDALPDFSAQYPGMVFVPGGTSTIGQSQAEHDAQVREMGLPTAAVQFAQERERSLGAFLIDRYEVSVAQYLDYQRSRAGAPELVDALASACPGTQMRQPLRENPHAPVRNVSYVEAALYCQLEGKRLPTFGEWERAAAGDDGRRYPWDGDLSLVGAFNSGSADQPVYALTPSVFVDGFTDVAPVTALAAGASPWGVQGLAGNVSEWVESQESAAMAPPYFHRGGSFLSHPVYLQTYAFQFVADPCAQYETVGFRCAADVPGNQP